MANNHTLHFYPDEKKLQVKDDTGAVIEEFPAWGGDPERAAAGAHGYEYTNKGTFIVLSVAPITTSRWEYSKIPWGQKVRISVPDMKVYDLSGTFIMNLDKEHDINHLRRAYADMPEIVAAIGRNATITVSYRFNDFGSKGIKTFTDKDMNGKFDAKIDPVNPHYIHATPTDEWDRISKKDKASSLVYSHGCIHMYPSDIDTLASKYITKMATTLTVH